MSIRTRRIVGRILLMGALALLTTSTVVHGFFAIPGNQVHGISMTHAETRSLGIFDDLDYNLDVATNRNNIVTWVRGRELGYRVAGDFGDVITFWADGAKEYVSGRIETDPKVATLTRYLEEPMRINHRPIVWVDFNESTGNFDVPELAAWNVTTVRIENIHSWPRNHYDRNHTLIPQRFTVHNTSIPLVYRSGNQTIYHAGKYSGFLTKGDESDSAFDQSGASDRIGDGSVVQSHIVKPEWIQGKLAFLLDLEVVQAIDYATIVSVIVGTTWLVQSKIRKDGR